MLDGYTGSCSHGPFSPSGALTYSNYLDVKVHVSQAIRKIINTMYSHREFPAKEATEILRSLGHDVHNTKDDLALNDLAVELAVLRAKLLKNYATILLTRPFFLQTLFMFGTRVSNQQDMNWRVLFKKCIQAAETTVEDIHEVHARAGAFMCDSLWWQVTINLFNSTSLTFETGRF